MIRCESVEGAMCYFGLGDLTGASPSWSLGGIGGSFALLKGGICFSLSIRRPFRNVGLGRGELPTKLRGK
jgi:hypothetical protein